STLVEPCATTTCLSSGDSADAGAYPGDFVFAVGTPVRSVPEPASAAAAASTPAAMRPATASFFFLSNLMRLLSRTAGRGDATPRRDANGLPVCEALVAKR